MKLYFLRDPCLELKGIAATYYDIKVLIRCQSTGKGAEKKEMGTTWNQKLESLLRYWS